MRPAPCQYYDACSYSWQTLVVNRCNARVQNVLVSAYSVTHFCANYSRRRLSRGWGI